MNRAPTAVAANPRNAWPIYRRLLGYSRPYWALVLLAMGAMALDALCTGGFAALTQPLLDDALLAKDAALIAQIPFLIMAIFLGRGIGSFTAEYCMSAAGRSVIRDLRQEVFDRYLMLPTAYFDGHSQGEMISRLTYNVEQVAEATTNAITVVVRDTLYVIAFLGVMLLQSVELTLLTMVIAPLIALIIAFVSRRFRRISRKIQDSMVDVTQRTSEVVSGHKIVKLHAGQQLERDRFATVNSNNRLQHLKLVATKAGSTSLVQLLAGATLAVIIYLATRPSMLDDITPGAFTAFMTAMLAILPSLKKLTNVHVMIQRGVAAAETIFDLIDEPREPLQSGTPVSAVKGKIEFQGVGLRYQSGASQVLKDVSFEAAPGTVTALVGRSGSGKTSLASLIPRFYQRSEGTIMLDGVDIDQLQLQSLRRHIAMVSQDIVLFADTIAHNISYGGNYSRDQIEQAAERANAMEFIRQLPSGLDTRLGENGIQLSGGQRQRVAIARAILKDAPILILDEATSALDTESERLIQDALAKVVRDRTTLVIAHRLSTVETADQVLVLDEGQIIERGTHSQLIKGSGTYAELHRLQFQERRR